MKHAHVPQKTPAHPPPFSILERIDVGETAAPRSAGPRLADLSVSSNGSTWVKLFAPREVFSWYDTSFSILERIDVGETVACQAWASCSCVAFSILERIDVGETLM